MKSITVCLVLLGIIQNMNAQINDSDTLENSDKSLGKTIRVGYYDQYENLPKLKFEILSEKEFSTYRFENKISYTPPQEKGQYYFIPTQVRKHKFKQYANYGEDEGFSGFEFVGYYPDLKLFALTENSTSESLGFGELFLLDSLTDYRYSIISFGDASVTTPILSPSNEYLVYYDNSVYEHHNCNIGILKINDKSTPEKYLSEFASYYSEEFAIEQLIWIADDVFVVKGYEEVYENEEFVKYYKYYKTDLNSVDSISEPEYENPEIIIPQNEVMLVEDILFNGKVGRYFSLDDFKKVFGKADSIRLMIEDEPCSYIFENSDGSKDKNDKYYYKDESRFENSNQNMAVDQFHFTKNNFILYKGKRIDKSTTIDDLESLFPNAIQNIATLEGGWGEENLQVIQLREDEEGISDGHINIFFKDQKVFFIWWWFPC